MSDAGVGAGAGTGLPGLGSPRVHLRRTDSTNERARTLAAGGAPHGTLVTASEQTAGRGRLGRTWSAPAGQALLMSLVLRTPVELLSLAAGVAVAEVVGPEAMLKWPNDVLVEGRKVAGILVEASPGEGWAVLGIGVNVAVEVLRLPEPLRVSAGTLGLAAGAVEPTLHAVLRALERWVSAAPAAVLASWRGRDALRDRAVEWSGGRGTGAGVDDDGWLLVALVDGRTVRLNAGQVSLAG